MVHPYIVSSGGRTVIVKEAKDAFDACVQAVKTEKFDTLGWLFEVKRKGYEDCYCSTERVCKAAGMWRES
jgi:squalene cyclase